MLRHCNHTRDAQLLVKVSPASDMFFRLVHVITVIPHDVMVPPLKTLNDRHVGLPIFKMGRLA